MRRFLVVFLTFIVLYHILVTFFSFWQDLVPPYILLLIRDVSRWVAVFLLVVDWLYVKKRKQLQYQFFSRWWWPLLLTLLLVVVGIIVSILLGVETKQIMVGIKYSLYYLVPFFSAIYIGLYWKEVVVDKQKKDSLAFLRYNQDAIPSDGDWRADLQWERSVVKQDPKENTLFKKYIYGLWVGIIVVIVVGRLWQIAKNIFPDWFMWFWYGPLGDYAYGENPPLYYLTGPQWFQRLSWLFSWPNNYGYFLVAFFWLYWFWVRRYVKKKSLKTILWMLYIGTLLATLSRGAILGVLIQVVLISYVIYQTERKIILWAIIAWIVAVGALSLLKWESTLAHIQMKISSLQYVSHEPWWFWLGSSWPSVLSQGWYLPENFFVQIMMDLGILGFLLWGSIWILILYKARDMYTRTKIHRSLLFFSTVWFLWLMVEWLFLHSLEDSMVNYLYFVVRWLLLWYYEYKGIYTTKKIGSDL